MNPESFRSSEAPEPEERSYPTSLELKELASIFAEQKTDDETILAILEEALMEPVPDPNDQTATEEFNAKMAQIRRMAEDQVLMTARLRHIWEQIEARTVSTDT